MKMPTSTITTAPTTKAIAVVQLKTAAVRDVLMPILHDDGVLVKVKAVGMNPTDWKHIKYGAADVGCRVGCDYAGIVEEVGNSLGLMIKIQFT